MISPFRRGVAPCLLPSPIFAEWDRVYPCQGEWSDQEEYAIFRVNGLS